MTQATATLTTQDAIARGRSERAAAFAALLRWLTHNTDADQRENATA